MDTAKGKKPMMQITIQAVCPYCSSRSLYEIERESAASSRHEVTCLKCGKPFRVEIQMAIRVHESRIPLREIKPYKPKRQD